MGEKAIKPSSFYIGISTKSEGINSFNKKFLEANKAIEVAKVRAVTSSTENKEAIISANDLGHLLMLLDARNPEELKHYADQKLGVIATYDEKNDTELLKTLYFYMDNECNLHKTSRAMNVSISGMRYRIQRFQELAEIDLSNSSCRFEVQIALQIYLVFGFLKLT
uniref:PucR C-terminal helix-turn-helix domain-containing protein n=1 Tax=Anaerobacillus isosaccharinicus TaxID=1532552 RepID=A0A1S2M8R8_9BACI